jgi:uncharacterized membrane protein
MNEQTSHDLDNDTRLEMAVGRVLRLGVYGSSVCLGVGLVIALAGTSPRLAGVLLTTGLLALLATPVSRVAVSMIDYLRDRDWLFAGLTLIVLAELAASVLAAFSGSPR